MNYCLWINSWNIYCSLKFTQPIIRNVWKWLYCWILCARSSAWEFSINVDFLVNQICGVAMLHFEQWGKGSWSSTLKSGWGGANYANNYRDNWQMSIETENVQKTSWILKGLTCMLWGQITFHFFACQFRRLPPHILLLKLAPSTFRFSSKVCVSHHQVRRVGFPLYWFRSNLSSLF